MCASYSTPVNAPPGPVRHPLRAVGLDPPSPGRYPPPGLLLGGGREPVDPFPFADPVGSLGSRCRSGVGRSRATTARRRGGDVDSAHRSADSALTPAEPTGQRSERAGGLARHTRRTTTRSTGRTTCTRGPNGRAARGTANCTTRARGADGSTRADGAARTAGARGAGRVQRTRGPAGTHRAARYRGTNGPVRALTAGATPCDSAARRPDRSREPPCRRRARRASYPGEHSAHQRGAGSATGGSATRCPALRAGGTPGPVPRAGGRAPDRAVEDVGAMERAQPRRLDRNGR